MHDQDKNQTDKTDANELSRRRFLKVTGMTTLGLPFVGLSVLKATGICIVTDASDTVAASKPVQWAIGELTALLKAGGVTVSRSEQVSQAPAGTMCIVAGSSRSSVAQKLLTASGSIIPGVPESLGLIPVRSAGKDILLACGYDERGLVYALLELADRVAFGSQPLDSLNIREPIMEQPANEIRSLTRLFTSDVEDKPWYNDREMWPAYLTMLATQRFNRFNLSFGIGYDFLQNVTDGYFVFAYPFLLAVPGYNVRVPQLPDTERDSNLKMLQFISEQTVARGMQFQLGLWMHGYEWLNSPNPNYTNEGHHERESRPLLPRCGACIITSLSGHKRGNFPCAW